jgi:hypothetical protein
MHKLRAGLAIAPALLGLGCLLPAGVSAKAEWAETPLAQTAPVASADPSPVDTSPGEPVPEKLLGTWAYSHQECEQDSDATPDPRKILASISFEADRTYQLNVEGFEFEGRYRYSGGNYPRLTLDNLLNFAVEGDTLQNWSEGDAVYLCGRVFVRERR